MRNILLAAAVPVMLSAGGLPPPAGPDWTAWGSGPEARLGSSLAAGDFDGDGYHDLVVVAKKESDPASGEGEAIEYFRAIRVYYGQEGGLSSDPALISREPVLVWQPVIVSLAVGDFNGDHFDDLAVVDVHVTSALRILIHHGQPGGLSLTYVFTRSYTWSSFGKSMAAGDVNGDGRVDLVLGAPEYDQLGGSGPQYTDAGKAEIIVSGEAGLFDDPLQAVEWRVIGDQEGAFFGQAIVVGDLNGDGISDIVVGAPGGEGRVFAFKGGPQIPMDPAWSATVGQAGAGFGSSLSIADVDGDGVGDLLVGAPLYDSTGVDVGAVFLFRGSTAWPATTPDGVLVGAQAGAKFGSSISSGDMDGDGHADLLAGAPLHDGDAGAAADAGAAFLHRGGPAGISAEPIWSLTGAEAGGKAGTVVLSVADLNGDSVNEIVVAAPVAGIEEGSATKEGRVDAFHTNLPPAPPEDLKQLRLGSELPVAPEGMTSGGGFLATARVGDVNGGQVRLQLELKRVGETFSGEGEEDLTTGEPSPAGEIATVEATGVAIGEDYHWRIRAVDEKGAVSDWVCFGRNPDDPDEIDLTLVADMTPTAQDLGQLHYSPGGAIGVGAAVFDRRVGFSAVVVDLDGDLSRLELEIRELGSPFVGSATASSDFVPNGGTASIVVMIPAYGSYHWQARAASHSLSGESWRSFGENAEGEADFTVLSNGSVNSGGSCGLSPLPARPAILLLSALAIVPFLRRIRGNLPPG